MMSLFRRQSYGLKTVHVGKRTVKDGEAMALWTSRGKYSVVMGPQRVRFWNVLPCTGGSQISFLNRYVAEPDEYLVIHGRDGTKGHVRGPAALFEDPMEHEAIEVRACEELAASQCLVVYTGQANRGSNAISEPSKELVKRRIVYGPAVFMPSADEWIHSFEWHGELQRNNGSSNSRGGKHQGKHWETGSYYQQKQQQQQQSASALADAAEEQHLVTRVLPRQRQFTKLELLQEQLYYNARDVLTKDEANLTVKLHVTYQLEDVELMLRSTNDPIGDMINALCTDIIGFVAARTFEEFVSCGEMLNSDAAYPELFANVAKIGFKVLKVVYRGYKASSHLQGLHDDSAAKRMQLRLADLEAEVVGARNERERTGAANAAEHRREQQALDTQAALALEEQAHQQRERHAKASLEAETAHLQSLASLGVDLSALLCAREEAKLVGGGGNGGVAGGSGAQTIRIVQPQGGGGALPASNIHVHTRTD